jgi:predicted amidohydrolase
MGLGTRGLRWILWIAVIALTGTVGAHEDNGNREEWQIWSPRLEQKPAGIKLEDGSLILTAAANPAAFGGWVKSVKGIQPGLWFRFETEYQVEGLRKPWNQVLVRLEWKNVKWERVGDVEFAWREEPVKGGWTRVWEDVQAPEGAKFAELQLWLYDAEQGAAVFRNPAVELTEAPAPRNVRLISVNYRPERAEGGEASVRELARRASEWVKGEADLIVFGEGVTVVGSQKTYAEVAEAADGPTVRVLGELAKTKKSYVVAGIYEKDGDFLYNTAVLIGRDGKLAGKYRKVYLPREEVERGLAPGNQFDVFETDFGKLGLMICYDVFFAEPAKALAMRGAEVIAMPIWGGDETLAKARSIEGRLFLVASGYDHPTYVQDPNGNRVGESKGNGSLAEATVDLSKAYRLKHLGDMRARRMRETRGDLPVLPTTK